MKSLQKLGFVETSLGLSVLLIMALIGWLLALGIMGSKENAKAMTMLTVGKPAARLGQQVWPRPEGAAPWASVTLSRPLPEGAAPWASKALSRPAPKTKNEAKNVETQKEQANVAVPAAQKERIWQEEVDEPEPESLSQLKSNVTPLKLDVFPNKPLPDRQQTPEAQPEAPLSKQETRQPAPAQPPTVMQSETDLAKSLPAAAVEKNPAAVKEKSFSLLDPQTQAPDASESVTPAAGQGTEPLPIPVESAPAIVTAQGLSFPLVFNPGRDRDPMVSPQERRAHVSYVKEEERKKRAETMRQQEALMTQQKNLSVERKRDEDPASELKKKLRVQGVLNTGEGILAIINDKIVGRGEKVMGATIVRVDSQRVLFKYQGRMFEKRLERR